MLNESRPVNKAKFLKLRLSQHWIDFFLSFLFFLARYIRITILDLIDSHYQGMIDFSGSWFSTMCLEKDDHHLPFPGPLYCQLQARAKETASKQAFPHFVYAHHAPGSAAHGGLFYHLRSFRNTLTVSVLKPKHYNIPEH